MKSNKQAIAGWVLSGLISAFLIVASASGKFLEWEGKAERLDKMGWTADVVFALGFVEVAVAVLFLIPRTAFIGAVLLTGYLGGAVATHVRVHDAFVIPIVIGVVAWIALGLRDPRVFANALRPPGGEPPA